MNKEETRRISPRVPKELRNFIHVMAETNLPRATHLAMFEYLLKNGMDELESGIKLKKKYNREWHGDDVRFQHHVPLHYTDRFNRIAEKMEPRPRKRELLIYVLNLGIQYYYKEYDEFGVRRD